MSKREAATRYMLIIKKLRISKGATFAEIADYLERESNIQGYDFNISQRTFKRDTDDIGSIYGIYIKFDFSRKIYFIEEEFDPEINDRLFEAFDVYNALKVSEQNREYLHLEKRKASGTEHLYGLLHAIKNHLQIAFSYQKYYEEQPELRKANPLALKEFKYRWYLIARNEHNKEVRRYALDRIADLEISKTHFPQDADFDIDKIY